jgi:regulator of sirC expression with transglutaminase-like and TPR domain
MDHKELKALINLLDDPDEEIFQAVSENLRKQGEYAIPELEKAWESTLDEQLQTRLENLIQEINFSSVREGLKSWIQSGAENLIEGAFHIARYQYPELSLAGMQQQLDKIRQDIWLELNPNLTALEKVRVINHFVYDVYKFSGNSSNFYSPQNSFINQVFETKKGNPISLSILYSSLARALEIPIFGVNLPKNYILAYVDEFAQNDSILFYINPFNRGAVLGRREIDYFLQQQSIEPRDSFYKPCKNTDTIQRLILNLINAYEKLGYNDKLKDLQALFDLTKDQGEES